MSMVEQKSRVVQETIREVFQPQTIATTACKSGYDIDADFQPSEFRDFLEKVTDFALAKVSENLQHACLCTAGQEEMLRQTVSPLVEKELKKVCKLAPEDLSFPEPSTALWKWLASLIWK